MVHAIELLLNERLSFRGFIQPRVRQCLDVLNGDYAANDPYRYEGDDDAAIVLEKLELAWEQACDQIRNAIDGMAMEPSMAHFAAVEDFCDTVLRSGGTTKSRDRWYLFYRKNRSDVWPEAFTALEAESRLLEEWRIQVKELQKAGGNLGKP